ncbi:hypothetical protein SALBM311S_02976 [Streptomyces alboniger]
MTRMSLYAGTRIATVSLSTCCPAGTTTTVLPPKVRRRMVSAAASAVPLPAATAIVACVMVSGDWP